MRFAKRAVYLVNPVSLVHLVPMLPTLPLLAALVACSSGDQAPTKQTYTAPDASLPVPPLPTPGSVLIVVKGDGFVGSDDGSFVCKQGGSTASCTPTHYGVTLYATGNLPFVFDHWEPSLSTNASLHVYSWSPSPITAVFTPTPTIGGDDGGNVGD